MDLNVPNSKVLYATAFEIQVPTYSDFRLHHPFSCIIAGPSKSGKTTLLVKILNSQQTAIDVIFDRIVYCYGVELPQTFKELAHLNVEFHRGIPVNIKFDPSKNNCLVLDDLMQECAESKLISDYFTRLGHHTSVSIFLLTQNFYQDGKYQRSITRNTDYIILFKAPRDRNQIAILGRHLANEKELLYAYDDATEHPNGYLLVDCSQKTHKDYRFRTNIVNANASVVYIKKP